MMDINTALGLGADELKESSEVEVGGRSRELARDQVSSEEIAGLVSQLSDASTREIDKLVSQLQKLRTQLKNAGVRIQGDIAGFAELSQQTMQLTSIIIDGVRKLPPEK
jgi:hypothetical protein